jgi:hypothetical protein
MPAEERDVDEPGVVAVDDQRVPVGTRAAKELAAEAAQRLEALDLLAGDHVGVDLLDRLPRDLLVDLRELLEGLLVDVPAVAQRRLGVDVRAELEAAKRFSTLKVAMRVAMSRER